MWNEGDNLAKCLTQLTGQTLKEIELIFVDDGSSDGSFRILEDARKTDERIRVIRHETNRGCAAARNTGIAAARGAYFICLDADDLFQEDLLEKLYEAAAQERAQTVVCRSLIEDARTGEQWHFGVWRRIAGLTEDARLVVDSPADHPDICELIDYVAWNKLVLTGWFRKLCLWFDEMPYYEDISYAFRVCLHAERLVFLAEDLIHYRMMASETRMTGWKIPKQFYMVHAFDRIYGDIRGMGRPAAAAAFINRALRNLRFAYEADTTVARDRHLLAGLLVSEYFKKWDVPACHVSGGLSGEADGFYCDLALSGRYPYPELILPVDPPVGISWLSDGIDQSRAWELSYLEELEKIFRENAIPFVTGTKLLAPPGRVSAAGAGERAAGLMDLYLHSAPVIFDVSGGDLANEVLGLLDYDLIARTSTVFCGYSDLTCVLNAIFAKTGRPGILYRLNNVVKDRTGLGKKWFLRTFLEGVDDLFTCTVRFYRGTEMSGVLLGGNIRCFLKLAGTDYFPDLSGKLLFLESLDTAEQSLRAQLAQMQQLGVFTKIRGVLFGRFGMEGPGTVPALGEVIRQYVPEQVPVAVTADVGHQHESKALWIGKAYHFYADGADRKTPRDYCTDAVGAGNGGCI